MRPLIEHIENLFDSFPRVSGDAPSCGAVMVRSSRFSPRERGCAPLIWSNVALSTVFPA